MTATAAKMQPIRREHQHRGNAVATLDFKMIRPISRNEIPLGRGKGRGYGLRSMIVIREFEVLLDHIVRSGLNPYEVVGEIDTTIPEIRIEKDRRKSFTQSFRVLLRDLVRERGLSDKIDVMEFNKGEKFFIVGKTE